MKLKYIDVLPRHYPSLPSYPSGLGVKKGDIVAVTEKEAKKLMLTKNGKQDCFEVIKAEKKVSYNTEEVDDSRTRSTI